MSAPPPSAPSGTPDRHGLAKRAALAVLATTALGTAALGLGTPAAALAADCSNAQFRTGASANLPDCRAYEQVSPVQKRGNSVHRSDLLAPNPGWSSADGDTLLFNVSGGVATDNAARGFSFPQIAERTATGWSNRAAANGPAPQARIDAGISLMRAQIPSADRKDLLFISGSPFTDDNPFIIGGGNGSVNLARGSAVDWLSKPTWSGTSPAPGSEHASFENFMPAGASADLSTSYFMSRSTLTPVDGASGRVADLRDTNEQAPGTAWALYRWKDGQLSNAGVLPPGSGYPGDVDPGGSVAADLALSVAGSNAIGSVAAAVEYAYGHSVSRDGRDVLFVSPDPKAAMGRPSQLYLAREGQPTVLLSKRTDADAPVAGTLGVAIAGGLNSTPGSNGAGGGGVYAVASRDHRVVLFSTPDMLTDDPGLPGTSVAKTYRYDTADGSLTYMPDLDRQADEPPIAPYDGMVFNMSDDGSRILYRTTGNVLKLWRQGQSTLTLSNDVGPPSVSAGGITDSRFSADDHTLVLDSRVPLAGELDHPPASGVSTAPTQVYRYTEDDQHMECLSCSPPSVSPRGPATFVTQGLDNGFGTSNSALALEPARGVSDDAKIVYFTTITPLSPDDHNAVADVYEWRDGALELLSSGDPDSRGEYFVDNSPSGDDVFFVSERRLTATDSDDLYDMYDARVGGGLKPDVAEVPCSGDGCQGAPGTPPALPGVSGPFGGPGSVVDPPPRVVPPKAASITVRKKAASSTVLTLSVRTSGAGTLRASGSGLTAVSRKASRSATYTVKVKLSGAARKALSKKGSVKVKASVRFTPAEGKAVSKTVSVTIKRAKRTTKKGR